MSLILVDGFPYDRANIFRRWRLSSFGVDGEVGTGGAVPGGRYLSIAAINGGTYRDFYSTETEFIAQFWMYSQNVSDAARVFSFMDRGAEQISLWETDGTLSVKCGSTTLGTAGSATISDSTWYQIMLRAKIHGSAGTVLLKQTTGLTPGSVDTILNLTGQNTCNTGVVTVNAIQLGAYPLSGQAAANGGYGFAFVVLADTTGSYCNDIMGKTAVEVLPPTGAGNYSQWGPSAGSNYACVDEIPPNLTDYVTGDTDEIDSYSHSGLSVTTAPIIAVAGSAVCALSDGGPAAFKTLARSGSSDGLGSEALVNSCAGTYLQSFVYVNPATNNPFTSLAFPNAEIGYKRTA